MLIGADYDPLDVEQNKNNFVQVAQSTIAHRLQEKFRGRFKKNIYIVKQQDQLQVEHPLCHSHIVLLTLQPSEQAIHQKLAEQMRD